MTPEEMVIADVFIDGGKTGGLRILHDGSAVDFRGGHTKVYSEDVLLALLRRSDMEIHPRSRYKDSYPEWLSRCPYNHPALARIVCPDGFVLSPENDYKRPADPTWWSDVEENPFEEENDEGPESTTIKPRRSRRLSEV